MGAIGSGPFFAFCGIGNPDAFFRDLESWHVPVTGSRVFRDHHRFDANDIAALERAAAQANAQAFLTTEKDEQNLAGQAFSRLPVYIAVIDLQVAPEDDFLARVEQAIQTRAGAQA